MKKMILLVSSLVFGMGIQAVDLKDCGFAFQFKRFFDPVENMTLPEKNKELVSYCDANVPKSSMFSFTPEDFTPLGKYSAEIIYLGQNGASVNTNIPYQWRHIKLGILSSHFKPIYLFIAKNNLQATRALIDLGADMKETILNGFYPLLFAYTKDMAALLMEHGAQVESVKRFPFMQEEKNLFEAVCHSWYEPELIPFYLNKLPEEERKDQAQGILDFLSKNAYEYFSHYARNSKEEAFMKKVDYLHAQGAQLDVEAIDFGRSASKEQERIKESLSKLNSNHEQN